MHCDRCHQASGHSRILANDEDDDDEGAGARDDEEEEEEVKQRAKQKTGSMDQKHETGGDMKCAGTE